MPNSTHTSMMARVPGSARVSQLLQSSRLCTVPEESLAPAANTIRVTEKSGAAIITVHRARGRVVRVMFLGIGKFATEILPGGNEIHVIADCECTVKAKFNFDVAEPCYPFTTDFSSGPRCAWADPLCKEVTGIEKTEYTCHVFFHKSMSELEWETASYEMEGLERTVTVPPGFKTPVGFIILKK